MYQEALSVLTSDARLPLGAIHNGHVYNFWQDDGHVRGVWRRARVDSYRAGTPEWEVLLDIDALAAAEERNWVFSSVDCLSPDYVRCMVELSDGGTDAGVWREFNTDEKAFVQAGFYLPEGKSSVEWLDADTLLVGVDTGEGSMTTSGYPRRVQRLLSMRAKKLTCRSAPSSTMTAMRRMSLLCGRRRFLNRNIFTPKARADWLARSKNCLCR